MNPARYLVGLQVRLPEPCPCQRCGRLSATLALVWRIATLRDAPTSEDGRRYYCPGCVGWLGPRARLIPPPEDRPVETVAVADAW